jgi:anti-sigma regulatory factor (Ser/Thr protein kinase)
MSVKKPLAGGELINAVFPAEKKKLEEIRKLLGSALHKNGFSAAKTAGLEISVVEHCENLIKHAYNGSKGDIKIDADIKYPEAKVKISDTAPAFNMFKAKLPELSERIKKGIGGKMGIRIILSMCDDVEYERRGGYNINTFIIRDNNGN